MQKWKREIGGISLAVIQHEAVLYFIDLVFYVYINFINILAPLATPPSSLITLAVGQGKATSATLMKPPQPQHLSLPEYHHWQPPRSHVRPSIRPPQKPPWPLIYFIFSPFARSCCFFAILPTQRMPWIVTYPSVHFAIPVYLFYHFAAFMSAIKVEVKKSLVFSWTILPYDLTACYIEKSINIKLQSWVNLPVIDKFQLKKKTKNRQNR